MTAKPDPAQAGNATSAFQFGYLTLVAVSVLALVATFFTSSTNLSFQAKGAIFVAVVTAYLIFSFVFFYSTDRMRAARATDRGGSFAASRDEKLLALEEASLFFGASLAPPDMFRLIAARINELVPFSLVVLYLLDEKSGTLTASRSIGAAEQNADLPPRRKGEGIIWKSFANCRVETDERFIMEKVYIPVGGEIGSAFAIPLSASGETFGVLGLYTDAKAGNEADRVSTLESIGTRISPLIKSSLTFERNISRALLDDVTELPNERAFYLVLENHLAESIRFPRERPLTILAIDVKDFERVNASYGHPSGNQILTRTAELIKGQLRQMDFLARSSGDEFLAVLPTADAEITRNIIQRIENSFADNPFSSAGEKIDVQLNFGFASFPADGESGRGLLGLAVSRKFNSKLATVGTVLQFPREFVN
jgi:diguanylate cyclase (GGDEF)-like protein